MYSKKYFIKINTILTFLVFTTFCFGQRNSFKLVSVKKNSDFNYEKLKSEISPICGLDSTFNVVSGCFTTYLFLEENFGHSFGDSTISKYYNVLILKANNSNKIVDGYVYTLGWAEFPSSCVLFKLLNAKIKLKDGLELSKLKFRLVGDANYCGQDKNLSLNQIIHIDIVVD